jgi:hypothetical protein
MIENHVHSYSFPCLSEYGQSDFGISHLETSKYIYGCLNMGTTINIIIIISNSSFIISQS